MGHTETKAEKIKRLAAELKLRREKRGNLLRRAKQHAKRIKVVRAALKQLRTPSVPGIKNGWHVDAIRNQVQAGIGAFMKVPARLVWHSTEGTSLPGYHGSHPHFTLDFKRKLLYQHIPVTSGAMALVSAAVAGVPGNQAHAIQVELVGFAKDSQNWTDAHYAEIAKLARWIEAHCDVRRGCSIKFVGNGDTNHMSNSAWLDYAGHCGHQHVPGNLHWDPGFFHIEKVI